MCVLRLFCRAKIVGNNGAKVKTIVIGKRTSNDWVTPSARVNVTILELLTSLTLRTLHLAADCIDGKCRSVGNQQAPRHIKKAMRLNQCESFFRENLTPHRRPVRFCGSAPALDAKRSASLTAAMLSATMIWLATLQVWPSPLPPINVMVFPSTRETV